MTRVDVTTAGGTSVAEQLAQRRIHVEGGWYWIANFAADRIAEVGIGPWALYSRLARRSNGYTRQVNVTIEQLSADLGYDRRTIYRWISSLEKAQMIRRDTGRGGDQNLYCILPMEAPTRQMDSASRATPCHSEGEWQQVEKGAQQVEADISAATGAAARVTPLSGPVTSTSQQSDSHATHNKEVKTISQYCIQDNTGTIYAAPEAEHDTSHFNGLVAAIDAAYSNANDGTACPWAPLAFKRLKDAIKSAPQWTHTEWRRCVTNRFNSDPERVNLGEAPETFIPRLKDFINAPRGRWGGVRKDGHDAKSASSVLTFEERRRANNHAAAAEVARRLEKRYGGKAGLAD